MCCAYWRNKQEESPQRGSGVRALTHATNTCIGRTMRLLSGAACFFHSALCYRWAVSALAMNQGELKTSQRGQQQLARQHWQLDLPEVNYNICEELQPVTGADRLWRLSA